MWFFSLILLLVIERINDRTIYLNCFTNAKLSFLNCCAAFDKILEKFVSIQEKKKEWVKSLNNEIGMEEKKKKLSLPLIAKRKKSYF